jgi:hypothetical protein
MFDSHILYVIIDIDISISKRIFKISKYTTPQSTIIPPKKFIIKKIKKQLKKLKTKNKNTSHHRTYNGMMLGSNV